MKVSARQRIETILPLHAAAGTAARPRRIRGKSAFTLYELMVVLLILGIVAAVAAPSFHRSLRYHQIESAARRVKQDLEYLQATARTRSATLTCEFNGKTYTMGGEVLRSLDHNGDYVVDLSAAPYGLKSVVVDLGGEPSIEFNGYGEATHDATITLGVGDETRTIQVVAATGAILSDAEN